MSCILARPELSPVTTSTILHSSFGLERRSILTVRRAITAVTQRLQKYSRGQNRRGAIESDEPGFQKPLTNFWNAPGASEPRSQPPSPVILQFADMTALGAGVGRLPPGRIFSAVGEEVGSGRIDW